MTKLYVAAIAMVLASCDGGVETGGELWGAAAAGSLEPPSCHATLPALTRWSDTAKRAPLPPPQTPAGVVLVTDSFGEPDTLWAFASDDGKLTAWVAFPRHRLGELVMQVSSPASNQLQLVDGEGAGGGSDDDDDDDFVAAFAMIKVPVPADPRMPPDAVLIGEIARFQLRVVDQAIEQTELCLPPKG